MTDGIAQHMHQGIAQQFDHTLVELDAVGPRLEADRLALRFGEIPDHTGKAIEQGVERNYSKAQGCLMDLADETPNLGLDIRQILLLPLKDLYGRRVVRRFCCNIVGESL